MPWPRRIGWCFRPHEEVDKLSRIAYIANQFPTPVEPYVWEEVQELRKRGHAIICCSVHSPASDRETQRFADETICLFPIRVALVIPATMLLLGSLPRLRDCLRRILTQGDESIFARARALLHTWLGAYYALRLKRSGVEHLHAHHGYSASWIAMVAARILRTGFSLTLHGSDLLIHHAYLDTKLANCSFCMTVSEFNRKHIVRNYPGVAADKIIVQRLGVETSMTDAPSFPRDDESILLMLSVGRLHRVKNHEFLIQGCRELKSIGLRFFCIIVGEGPEHIALERLIRKLDLEEEVKLFGQVPRQRLDSYYSICDLVVLTSRSEGLPLVLMEAMAHGRTVLAPEITGIPELVIPGKTGFLYTPDSLEDFVAKVKTVSLARNALAPMRREARRHVVQYFNRATNLSAFAELFLSRIYSSTPRPQPMKILYCNKYNFDFSGTEAHLFEVMQLMRAGGHETALFSMLDDRGAATPYDKYFVPHIDFKAAEHSISQRARLAAGAIYSRDAQLRIRPMIDDFAPDVAHIRNIYHHISPSILWELRKQGVPVIYHLNDFKILCPNRNFMANGEACEKCAAGSFWRVATEGCYDGPHGASLVLAAEAYVHSWLRTYQKCVNLVLVPSEFAKRKMTQYGWQEESIVVLPHFQKISQAPPSRASLNASILYFGRLSPEKGVADLLRAMKLAPHVLLNIAGEGPQRMELERLREELGVENVRFTGHLRGAELNTLIEQSQFTVFPSKAYEILGKSILESYAWGRPVVASDLGSRRELVLHGQTGLLFPAGDVEKMAEAISSLAGNPKQAAAMGEAGLDLLRERHSPEKYSLALNQVYGQVVATRTREPRKLVAVAGPKLQVAFIGGRGVYSKYAGIETYYEEVGKRLVEQGHEVTAYCRNYFTPDIEKHAGMNVVRLPTIRSKHLDTFVHTLLSTLHATFSNCDVVHYHALGPALFSFLPRLRGKKTVVTVQGLDWQRKKWGRIASAILRLGERAAVRMPDATMVVSRTLHDYYRDRYHALTDYVPNGSDVRIRGKSTHLAELGLKPADYILFLGRLSPEKNCHLLIEAFQRINTSNKLVLAGGSSYSDRYARRIRKQAGDQVRLLDWVAGPARDELIANALLFVLPSDMEGLSVALLEAMGAGVCVLTSDIPENREVVDGAGFTFKRGDVADLERMLRLLLMDAPVRKAAARRGQQRVRDRYLWRTVAEDVGRVYRKVMEKEDLVPDRVA